MCVYIYTCICDEIYRCELLVPCLFLKVRLYQGESIQESYLSVLLVLAWWLEQEQW